MAKRACIQARARRAANTPHTCPATPPVTEVGRRALSVWLIGATRQVLPVSTDRQAGGTKRLIPTGPRLGPQQLVAPHVTVDRVCELQAKATHATKRHARCTSTASPQCVHDTSGAAHVTSTTQGCLITQHRGPSQHLNFPCWTTRTAAHVQRVHCTHLERCRNQTQQHTQFFLNNTETSPRPT